MKLTYKFKNDEKVLNVDKIDFLDPDEVTIYTKADDEIYVEDGDYVYINQLIKTSKKGIKTYATIAGTIKIKNGIIKIVNDKTESKIVAENIIEDISNLKKQDVLDICDELGIEYDNKLLVDKLKSNAKLLVVNAMDIEPYQFNNNYLLEDSLENVLKVTELLSNVLNVNAYFLLNKFDDNNIDATRKIISKYPNIIFKTVDEEFPFTVDYCVAKKYFNEHKVEDILFFEPFGINKIYVALNEGVPVSERYVTISINGDEKIVVVKCKYGTNLKDIISKVIKEDLNDKDVYLNNYMRGIKCENIESLIVNDNIKTIFILNHEEKKISKCIKCGRCVDICPVNINPLEDKLDATCIRCGLCNNICPSNINLLNKGK